MYCTSSIRGSDPRTPWCCTSPGLAVEYIRPIRPQRVHTRATFDPSGAAPSALPRKRCQSIDALNSGASRWAPPPPERPGRAQATVRLCWQAQGRHAAVCAARTRRRPLRRHCHGVSAGHRGPRHGPRGRQYNSRSPSHAHHRDGARASPQCSTYYSSCRMHHMSGLHADIDQRNVAYRHRCAARLET
jgi:hypothetical protein